MSLQEIQAARTPAGGWTRQQLAEWGIPWPAQRGWKRRLAAQGQARHNQEGEH